MPKSDADLRREARAQIREVTPQEVDALPAGAALLPFPLVIAVAHNGGAALLVLLLTMLNYMVRIPAETIASPEAATRLSSA